MSERLSRSERRALHREDERLITQPLNIGGDPRKAEAHVRHIVRLLRNDASVSPCSDAVFYAAKLFDKTAVTATKGGLACRRGCSHCCHQRVTVDASEAFFIAHKIRNHAGHIAAVTSANRTTTLMSQDARWRARIPCPFLNGTECGIYDVRPIACRTATSLDVNACIAGYVDLKEQDMPIPLDYIVLGNGSRMILYAALELVGLSHTGGYEMNGAIVRALEDGCESRWLAGQDVFAGVDVDPALAPSFSAEVKQMAENIRPTI